MLFSACQTLYDITTRAGRLVFSLSFIRLPIFRKPVAHADPVLSSYVVVYISVFKNLFNNFYFLWIGVGRLLQRKSFCLWNWKQLYCQIQPNLVPISIPFIIHPGNCPITNSELLAFATVITAMSSKKAKKVNYTGQGGLSYIILFFF